MNGKRTLIASVVATFLLGSLPGDAQAAHCGGEPTDVSVAYGELISCDISPGSDTDVFRFNGIAGSRVLAELLFVNGINFVPRIQLIAPDGTVLRNTWSPARAEEMLPLTGVYTVVASDFGADHSGAYTMMVSCVGGPCLPDAPDPPNFPPGGSTACEPEPTDMFPHFGTRVVCDIAPGADTDIYRFTATAGDRILAEALPLSGTNFVPRMEVIAPDGSVIRNTWSPARADEFLTQTGTYTAVVWDFGSANPGQYAFTVSCTAGTCLPPGSGPGVEVELDGCTVCRGGDRFTVLTHFFNTRQTSVLTEVKIGFRTPSGATVTIANPPHAEFNFPGGFDFSGEFLSIPWPANQPPGVWSLEITVIGRDLGEVYAREVKFFTVAP